MLIPGGCVLFGDGVVDAENNNKVAINKTPSYYSMLLSSNQLTPKGKALASRLISNTSEHNQGLHETRARLIMQLLVGPLLGTILRCPRTLSYMRLTEMVSRFYKGEWRSSKKFWQKSWTPTRTISNRKGNENSSYSVKLEGYEWRPTQSAARETRASERATNGFGFNFWLDNKVARDFEPIT